MMLSLEDLQEQHETLTADHSAFLGVWRIVEMELWGEEYLNLLGQATIEFNIKGFGSFQFGAVQGWIDCRYADRGRAEVDFSWEGQNDRDDACGRGWAVVHAEGTLYGRLYIHDGDDSAFLAARSG